MLDFPLSYIAALPQHPRAVFAGVPLEKKAAACSECPRSAVVGLELEPPPTHQITNPLARRNDHLEDVETHQNGSVELCQFAKLLARHRTFGLPPISGPCCDAGVECGNTCPQRQPLGRGLSSGKSRGHVESRTDGVFEGQSTPFTVCRNGFSGHLTS